MATRVRATCPASSLARKSWSQNPRPTTLDLEFSTSNSTGVYILMASLSRSPALSRCLSVAFRPTLAALYPTQPILLARTAATSSGARSKAKKKKKNKLSNHYVSHDLSEMEQHSLCDA